MPNIHPLRAIRKQRGLTQAQLAAMVGLSQPTISKIEAGGAHIVRLSDLRAIADRVGVSSWRDVHGAGQPLLAETDEDLSEITGGYGRCACAGGDPVATLAEWAGRDQSDPAFVGWCRELHDALTTGAHEEATS